LLGCRGIHTDNGGGMLLTEAPAAFARLATRSRRNVSLAPTDPAIGIARLDNDRLELGERAIRKDVGLNQGKPYRPQCEFLQLLLFF
jgi:hypothetical protein